MRDKDKITPPMSFAICVESRNRDDHALRSLKRMIDGELATISPLSDAR